MATTNMLKGDFPLPRDGYLIFDSLGVKAALKERLTANGIFSDQAYEGSNISQIIDILAYNYNTLIYYLNRTAPESLFGEAQIYENMNMLTKLLGYNPIGNQTSILSFNVSATQSMDVALYTLPRYTYMTLGSISYSFKEDVSFYHSTSAVEYLEDISKSKLLYQGRFIEYPAYTATGEENEIVYLLPGDNVIIDHFNIDVYVKSAADNKWSVWTRTNSLYLESSTDRKYEIRLNEKLHYEIKFGNDINGKKLENGDIVAIYFLMSDGNKGEVGINALQAGKMVRYSSTQFDEIMNDIQLESITIIPDDQINNLIFDNSSSSTYYAEPETVENIRTNAPATFRSQYRLVTESDFESHVRNNYSNLIHDIKVVNNWSYVSTYLKYFYNIGLNDPNNVGRVLYNQVNFADSCNFNNVYMFIIPKVISNTKNPMSYLNPSLKQLIISGMRDIKTLTCEPITVDPIFISYDLGVSTTLADSDNTELLVIRNTNSRRDAAAIKKDIYNIFVNYFSRTNCNLGQIVDLNYISNAILSVDGVSTYYTNLKNSNVRFEGLSMVAYNPIYPNDIKVITQNQTLDYFQFPFLANYEEFINKITVETTMTMYDAVEY